MQPWEGHRNSVSLQEPGEAVVGISMAQFISSLPSVQSSRPSHRALRGKHCREYAHGNWAALQDGRWAPDDPTGGKGVFSDSIPSVVIHMNAFEIDKGNAGNAADCGY